MRLFYRLGIVAFVLMLSCQLQSQNLPHYSPPAPYAVQVALPNGQSFSIIAKGNDEIHWSETTDGYTVLKNDEGYYEYAKLINGQLVKSGIQAIDPEQRSLAQSRQLLSINKHVRPEIASNTRSSGIQALSSSSDVIAAVPSEGKVKLLAICIEYPDLPHRKDVSYFSRLMNEGADGNPSFRDYYLKNSYGKLDISVDVVGWVKASKTYSYYSEENGRDRAKELVKEAIQAAEAQGVDYSVYDNDSDDDVDAVIIIHSGPGAEEGGRNDYIWSHRWTIPYEYFDNKFIFDYTIQPETRTSPVYGESVGIGIFCHEFGHLLGLPDLYDTESFNGSSHGIGNWGLMGLGQWLGNEDYPSAMSAWSKERLGWAEANNITQSYGKYSLKPADQTSQIYRIETGRDNEYFLLENRQQSGFDAFQRGKGLAIWHINTEKTDLYPFSNNVNGNHELKGVDLEEADGNADLDDMRNRSDDADLFPGSSGQTSFNVFSNPTSESYYLLNNNTETGISIENITENADGSISFTHSRVFSNGGNSCAIPLIAFNGNNDVSTTTSWFEFTMPKAGSFRISTEEAGRPTNVSVYLNCNDNTPIAQATSRNDDNEHIPINVKYLPKGQKVFIQWAQVNGQTKPFTFKITTEGSVAQQDSLALVAMYNQMGGTSWAKRSRWLSGPVSSWEGVSVENARVTQLAFSKAGLKGSLPDLFYNLTELRSLILDQNEINGGLNVKLGQLTKLEEIIINEGNLNAKFLTSLGSLKQLNKLQLINIKLNESLPPSIDQLTKLEHLEIDNAALSGNIPAGIGKLSALKTLILSNNQLIGELPQSFGELWELEVFRADNNQLNNAVPSGLMTLPALKTLSLENNRLSALPESFFSSNVLTTVNLSRNLIGGNLPKTVNRSSAELLTINLSKNRLVGTVSEALAKINFSRLDLSENQLEGMLPQLKVATYLSIASNRLSALNTLTDLALGSGKLEFWCQGNHLSFEDLLPNAEFLTGGTGNNAAQRYSPQDTITTDIKETIPNGGSIMISLEEDKNVSSNRYAWYLNGNLVSTTENGSIQINNFNNQKAGDYICKISNTQLSGLTLVVDGIQLRLQSKEEQIITIQAIPSKTFGDEAFGIQASSSADLPLTYTKVSGPISLNNNNVTINGAGEAKIKVSQAGNDIYHSEEKEVVFTIAKASQTIDNVSVSPKVYGAGSFALEVKSSSGLPVSLSIESGNVSLSGKVVHINGAGDISIIASQQGNDDYLAANNITIRFNVSKAPQTIAFPTIDDQVYGNAPLKLNAIATSGLAVNLRVVEGPAVWSEEQLVMIGAGDIVLEATQNGNENFQAATAVLRSFKVAKGEQKIFFDEILNRDFNDPPLELEAYSSVEGLAVNFRIIDGDASISDDNVLTVNNTGKITIEAFHPGNTNYEAAVPVQRSFYVTSSEKQMQTIVLQDLPDTVSILDELTLEWSVSSGLQADIITSGPAVVQNNILSFNGTGEVTVSLSQSGNEEFNAAQTVTHTVYVDKASQVISVNKPNDIALKENTLILTAESDSGLPVTFRIISGGVSLNGNTLNLEEEGLVVIEASQAGNEIYDEAEPIRFSFRIYKEARASQTLSYDEVPDKTFGDAAFEINIKASSDLPISLEANGPVSLDGQKITITGTGLVEILAYQEGNDTFAPSDSVRLSFEILPAPQTLQFELEKIEDNVYLLKASTAAKLPVTFTVLKGEAEVKGDTLFVLGQDKVEIQAQQAGNENYLAAEPVSKVIDSGQVTSIDDLIVLKIKIYPNPSNGVYQLDLGGLKEGSTISIFDIKGKLIHQRKNHLQFETIDLINQASGVYILSIEHKEKPLHYRLIKK